MSTPERPVPPEYVVNDFLNRAQRRAVISKRNLVRQVTSSGKTIWHRKHFNQAQFGDFVHMWKRLNEMPKQNSKRSKKRGLNAVLNIG